MGPEHVHCHTGLYRIRIYKTTIVFRVAGDMKIVSEQYWCTNIRFQKPEELLRCSIADPDLNPHGSASFRQAVSGSAAKRRAESASASKSKVKSCAEAQNGKYGS